MEVVASLSQGRTAAAQCGLFTHKSVPVIFEPPCIIHGVLHSFCGKLTIYLSVWTLYLPPHPPKALRPNAGQGLLILEVSRSHSHTPQSVGLLWKSDQPVAETCN